MEEKKESKYYPHKIDNLLVVSRIFTIHYFEFDKHFASEGEEHDFWEMVYVDRGEFLCTAGEETLVLREGEAVFHRPGEYHRHMADGLHAPSVFVISFECRSEGMRFFEARRMLLPRDSRRHLFGILAEASATFDIPVSDPLTKRMKLLSTPALGGMQMIKNRLEMFLIMLLRQEVSKAKENETFLDDETTGGALAAAIISKMRAHLYQDLSVEELCEGIAYSRSYIFKEFRLATGRTIADYYNEMKISEAKHLIREGKLSFAEIADKLSFESPNYFGKTFKRYTGITPRSYRMRYRGV